MSDRELDVFDLFGTPDADPALTEAVQALSDAVRDAISRSGGLSREPDLMALSDAVRAILEAAGHHEAVSDASRWYDYEASGRERTHRAVAWELSDKVFRQYMEAIGRPCGEPTTGGQEDRPLPLPGGLPLSVPEE